MADRRWLRAEARRINADRDSVLSLQCPSDWTEAYNPKELLCASGSPFLSRFIGKQFQPDRTIEW